MTKNLYLFSSEKSFIQNNLIQVCLNAQRQNPRMQRINYNYFETGKNPRSFLFLSNWPTVLFRKHLLVG
jgi:uncharacterized protein YydD (DUF2326 family)